MIMQLRGLPNLAVVHTDDVYRRCAHDVADPRVGFLTLRSTYHDAEALVRALRSTRTRRAGVGLARTHARTPPRARLAAPPPPQVHAERRPVRRV